MSSVLEIEYIEPSRPYSKNELINMRNKLYTNLRIGNVIAAHNNCHHFYYVKQNSRKEKDILNEKKSDCGNCSVCWKLNKTPKNLRCKAEDLIEIYSKNFYNEPEIYTYNLFDLETSYYKWLCE
jgi:hypothetical protein